MFNWHAQFVKYQHSIPPILNKWLPGVFCHLIVAWINKNTTDITSVFRKVRMRCVLFPSMISVDYTFFKTKAGNLSVFINFVDISYILWLGVFHKKVQCVFVLFGDFHPKTLNVYLKHFVSWNIHQTGSETIKCLSKQRIFILIWKK